MDRQTPTRVLTQRLQDARATHGSLLRSSGALGVQMVVLAIGGFLFWIIAANRFDAETVGLASALFTIVRVSTYATSMGLPIAVARYGSSATTRSAGVFSWSMLVAVAGAVVAAIVVALLANDRFGPALITEGRVIGALAMFVAVVGLALTAILDNREIGLGDHPQFLARHVLNGLVRLPLVLLIPSDSDAFWLWAVLIVATPLTAITSIVTRVRSLGPYSLRPVEDRQQVQSFASVNYASLLLAQAPFVLAPLVVLTFVEPEENAAFHIVWAVAEIIFLVPNFLGKALLIEGASETTELRPQARLMLRASAGLALAAIIVSIPWALLLPTVYGDEYERSGLYLIGLVGASLPFALTATAVNVARIQNDTRATLVISLALTIGVAVPAVALAPSVGAEGVTIAWILGHCVAAFVAARFLLPLVRTDAGAVPA